MIKSFFIIALILLFNFVSGFSPVNNGRVLGSNIKMMADFKNEIGALPPLGYFDPLG